MLKLFQPEEEEEEERLSSREIEREVLASGIAVEHLERISRATGVVVMAGGLLEQAEKLLKRGIHPFA
ncbi:hypothetical protein GIB67_004107 [Kingdonia uniflora]|uniref:Uncharacterized protein n=1 Tax=Kingdonia uniflora TaxID=39325 RepID=A0A7J7NR95_9MAGN|nr:hypothetical protein GIB67_040577 [Kingdonia uniflora]KAF6169715.1 hypothetical protein GIB67_004107 [Kingdonia uniflora]